MRQLPHRQGHQCHILFIPRDLMPLPVHHQPRPRRIAHSIQLQRMLQHKVRLAHHMHARDGQCSRLQKCLIVNPLIVAT